MNWQEFFEMGGYAFYVWTSWGITAGTLLWLFTQAKMRNAKIKAELIRQITREAMLDDQKSNSNNSNP